MGIASRLFQLFGQCTCQQIQILLQPRAVADASALFLVC